jgi:hypothetical protein
MMTLVPYRLSTGSTAASRVVAHASVTANFGVLGDGEGDGEAACDGAPVAVAVAVAVAAGLPTSSEQPAIKTLSTTATATAESFDTAAVCHDSGAPWGRCRSAASAVPLSALDHVRTSAAG